MSGADIGMFAKVAFALFLLGCLEGIESAIDRNTAAVKAKCPTEAPPTGSTPDNKEP